MMVIDFAAVHQDDALVDGLSAVDPTVPPGDALAVLLRAWRDAVDATPIRPFVAPVGLSGRAAS